MGGTGVMVLKIVSLLVMCFLLFTQPLLAESEPVTYLNPSYISLSITSMEDLDKVYFSPIASMALKYTLMDYLSLGVDASYQDLGVQRASIFLKFMLKEPLSDGIWTSFQLGLTNLQFLDTKESYGGISFGAFMKRYFRENWSAHTNVKFTLLPGILIPSFDIGFSYYLSSRWSFDMKYRGYDLDRIGITIGTTFYH